MSIMIAEQEQDELTKLEEETEQVLQDIKALEQKMRALHEQWLAQHQKLQQKRQAATKLTVLPYLQEDQPYQQQHGTEDKVFPDQQQALEWLEQHQQLIEDAWIDGEKLFENGSYMHEADVTKQAQEHQHTTMTIEVIGGEEGYTASIASLTGAPELNSLTEYGVQLEAQARSAGEALILLGKNFQRAGFLE